MSWLIGDGQDSHAAKLTPFSERGSAVLLEDVAAVEVAVLVEVVVDRGMGGGVFMQGLYVPELLGRTPAGRGYVSSRLR